MSNGGVPHRKVRLVGGFMLLSLTIEWEKEGNKKAGPNE